MNLKLHRWFALFLAVRLPLCANATSIAVILTPDRIVVAADGKTSQYEGGKQVPASGRVSPKFRLLVNGNVLFTFGLAKIGKDPHPAFFAGDIFSLVQKKVTKKSSLSDVANIVATRLGEKFNGINEALGTKVITREIQLSQTGVDNPLTAIGVAGYENGQPRLYLIRVDIDWKSNTAITPKPVLLYPDANNPTVDIFSSEINTSGKDEWIKCRVPEGLPPSEKIEQTARSIVDLGIEARPDTVGLPINTIILSSKGGRTIHTHHSRMADLCSSQNKQPSRTAQKVRPE
jgi:hypothetical protein